MWFQTWLDAVRVRAEGQRSRPKRQSTDRRGRPTRRLLVEGLEDRRLMTFLPAVSYEAGANLQAIVAADFNNDGRLDLATANTGSNSASVLLGNPDGTFQSPLNSAAGENPQFLVAADFNNDGKLDLVANNHYSHTYLLLGNGDGTFQAPIFTELDYSRQSLAAGDFNADGNMDLAHVSTEPDYADYVQVYLGDGTGHFTWWGDPVYFSDYEHTPMAVADLNDDGRPDVVLAHEDSMAVSVLLCNADGTLSYHSYFPTGNNTRSVAIGDFTGDGIPDLVAAGYSRVAILPGFGDGNFGAPIVEMTNNIDQMAVATADFNGDGRPDAITTDLVEGTLTALLGLGNGMLSLVADHAVGLSPVAVAVGDFNGDGRPDVAAANAGTNTVSVLLNDGAWPDPNALRLRIDDVTVTEGNAGATSATFTVTLSAASAETVTVEYVTASGTATAGSDYQVAYGTLVIPAGQTTGTITVLVNGDRLPESSETLLVNLSNPTGATIADAQAVGVIIDDEPRISITDVTKLEGKKNQKTLFIFTVQLTTVYDQPVTMSFRTVNGTATSSDGDYIAKNGTLTFAPGETTKTITIEVKGDSKKEANETFYLDLFGLSSNAQFTKNRGLGTILNDD